ncbi:MAG: hypothetical protein J6334_12710 [Kiritimatiellae bacterium]|nr:hypothetical protein [Kiritimatiellia bacterium]
MRPTDHSIEQAPRSSKERCWCLSIRAGFIFPILMMVGILLFLTVNVPYWDDFDAILAYLIRPTLGERFAHLADFHNEHRILTARLILELLYGLTGTINFRTCMAIGGLFLTGYGLLFLIPFKRLGRRGILAFLPCFWLIVSFIHYENLCWAMTAISNLQGPFWALLAMILTEGKSFKRLAGALVAAVLCTFSTGGGVSIWPCLLLALLFRPGTACGSWGASLSACGHPDRTDFSRFLLTLVAGILALSLFFTGFSHHASEMHIQGFTRVIHTVIFFISFVGSWVPHFGLSLLVGSVMLLMTVWIAWHFPKLRNPLPLFFLVYLFGNMAAAALFRCDDFRQAVSFRYILFPISALTCLIYLVTDADLIPQRIYKPLLILFASGAFLYTTGFLVLGAPLFAHRNEILRHNVLCWPAYPNALRCPSARYAYYDGIMHAAVAKGIYDPERIKRPGETITGGSLKWLAEEKENPPPANADPE